MNVKLRHYSEVRAAGFATLRLDGTQTLPACARVVQSFRRGEAAVLLVSLKAGANTCPLLHLNLSHFGQ